MTGTSETVLFVDDDENILKSFRRQFRTVMDIETARGAEEALKLFADDRRFAVVISDMRMPGMSGIELLSRVKAQAADTVRMMLTGYADLQVTIDAVNAGNIFRFLTKPCSQTVLEKAIRDGLEQYRLVTAERELLEGTLHGSIRVLSEMLSLANPLAFGRTSQVQRIALAIGADQQIPNLWDLKIAAMLFPLGCVILSEATLDRVLAGQVISDREQTTFSQHAAIAGKILSNIPRLESVAEIVAYQDKGFDGSGNPQSNVQGTSIPLGARILKVASDFEIAYRRIGNTSEAFRNLEQNSRFYDPSVLESLRNALHNGICQSSRVEFRAHELREGMVLATDVRTRDGKLMISGGQELTETILRRLRDLCDRNSIRNTFDIELLGEMATTALAEIQ
ncbi:MAG: response regulator [Fuerstiella sp.]